MTKHNGNRLIILDLDHTLIYSTDIQLTNTILLLEYSPNLFVHERPFARELVDLCNQNGDVIIFTTSVKNYAEQICNKLSIDYKELHSRKDCEIYEGMYVKSIDESWLSIYDQIIIIDDSPEIWDTKSKGNCQMLVPEKFTGSATDDELRKVISSLLKIISE